MTPFTRTVTFDAAYDKRPEYGIHGVTIRFVVKGELGAVHFVLYTNWQLPHVTEEHKGHTYEAIGGDPHWMERPMQADLGYHSPVPLYDGQTVCANKCEYLDGQPCYMDGSALNAKPVYHRLLAEGDAGVWDALEQYYHSRFERSRVESGLCCMARHANAVPPWTCDCPCHAIVEEQDEAL